MTNTKRVTKREMYTAILAELTNPAHRAFIEHELELLTRKNASGEKKMTPTQKENVELKEAILDAMEPEKAYTVTDIMAEVEALAGLSNQRVSALVRQLKEDGLVIRTEEKRKAYFTKA